jgi:hypothetical protein
MCIEGPSGEDQASYGHFLIEMSTSCYHGGAIITHRGIEDIPYPRNGIRGDSRVNGVVNTKVSMDSEKLSTGIRLVSGSHVYGRKRDWRQSEVHLHNHIRL